MPDDPNNEPKDGTNDKKTEKETPKETETPKKEEEKTVKFREHELSPAEAEQLMAIGEQALRDAQQKQEKDKEQDNKDLSETEKLGKSVADMRTELTQTRKELADTKAINRLNSEITTLTQSNEFLKSHPELMKDIQEDVWRGVATQSNVPVSTHFENTVKKYERTVQNAINAYTKTKLKDGHSTEGQRGSGTGVTLPESGKATREDIISGAARKHLMDAIQREE